MGAQADKPRPMQRIEDFVRQLQALPPSDARTIALELLHCVMDFHGAALERMVELLPTTTDPGYALQTLASDPLVGSMLLLYDLHPLDFDTRVKRALDRVRPYLQGRGAEVQLLGTGQGLVRLRLHGASGCTVSAAGEMVEDAIREAAPDAVSVEIEGMGTASANSGFVPLARLQPAVEPARPEPAAD